MSSFSVLTAFWIIKPSQVKERSKEENRVKRIEDSSFSLPLPFWNTSRSPFYTCYIPFQRSGIQESNASNHVRFGADMRKIWPSEDNCSRLVRNSHNTFNLCEACAKLAQHSHNTFSLCETCTTLAQHLQLVRNSHNTRTTPSNSHSPCVVRIFLCSADSTLDLFF